MSMICPTGDGLGMIKAITYLTESGYLCQPVQIKALRSYNLEDPPNLSGDTIRTAIACDMMPGIL